MFLILNRALSWAITSFGNKFCLRKRSRLIKALDNRFYVKFMQLEKGLLRDYLQVYSLSSDQVFFFNSIENLFRVQWMDLLNFFFFNNCITRESLY